MVYVIFAGSGKSTRCQYAIRTQLQFPCLWVTLQSGIATQNAESFWPTFGRALKVACRLADVAMENPVQNARSFVDFFVALHLKGQCVVLFIDEFDALLQEKADREILEQLLGSLRAMKESRDSKVGACGLQAVVIIGPLSILQAGKLSRSPFNITDAIEAPYFTKEEVQLLFQEFQQQTAIHLEDGIVDHIFSLTSGHQGLTCFCGKKIHEELAAGESKVTLRQWTEFATLRLPFEAGNSWATVGRLVETVMQKQHLSFLCSFLYTLDPVEVQDERVIQQVRYIDDIFFNS